MNPDEDDDPTVIDYDPTDTDTPTELARCTECGRVVFFDSFTEAASIIAEGMFNGDRCVRAHDSHWHWCGENRKFVYYVPKSPAPG